MTEFGFRAHTDTILLYNTTSCTVQYSTVLYCTVQYNKLYSTVHWAYSTVQYSNGHCSAVEFCAMKYCTLLWRTTQCSTNCLIQDPKIYCINCTIFYCMVLTVQFNPVLYDTVLYHDVLHCIVQCSIVLYCSIIHCTVLYCTVLYCTVLYCTVLYCTVLYCTVGGWVGFYSVNIG